MLKASSAPSPSKSSTLRHWSKTKAPAHVFRAPGFDAPFPGYLRLTEKSVEYLGMLHSHPQRWNGEDNDEFSWGDGLVSAISGRIYLTTPHGELYALDRKDSWKVIPAGFAHDALVSQNKIAGEIKKMGNEHPGFRIAYLPFFKGAELYDRYLADDARKIYNWLDRFTEGSAYQTFDADAYNTRTEK